MLKKLINIGIIIGILFNIKSILLPIRNMQLTPFIATLLGRTQLYYFLITAFFIIPVSFRDRDKKRKVLIEIWSITIIMLIVKFGVDFIRAISWR